MSIARRYADAIGLPSAIYTAGNQSGRRIGPLGELLFPGFRPPVIPSKPLADWGAGTRLEMIAPGVWAARPLANSKTYPWESMGLQGGFLASNKRYTEDFRKDFLWPVAPGVWSVLNLAQLNSAALAVPDAPQPLLGGGGGSGGSGGFSGFGGGHGGGSAFQLGLVNWRI